MVQLDRFLTYMWDTLNRQLSALRPFSSGPTQLIVGIWGANQWMSVLLFACLSLSLFYSASQMNIYIYIYIYFKNLNVEAKTFIMVLEEFGESGISGLVVHI